LSVSFYHAAHVDSAGGMVEAHTQQHADQHQRAGDDGPQAGWTHLEADSAQVIEHDGCDNIRGHSNP
jgi:hypothetical protein